MQNNYQNNNLKNGEIQRKNNKKPNSADRFALLWSITAIGISILISLVILFTLNASWMPSAIKHKVDNFVSGINKTPGIAILGGRQNILLMGVDSNGSNADPFKGTRSDSMIVLSVDPFSKTANAVSIPRDSKVFIAEGHGLDKINAAHAFGGPELTVKTIEQNFGIKLTHYIVIDHNGIKDLVKAIGGVPVYVEKRMHYRDRSAGLNIDLYPGYQMLNPEQAEGYVRFRHDAIGDIGRIKRQQWFIRGLVKRLQSPDMLIKIPELIQVASKYIRTDMNFYELSQLAAYSKSINLADVQLATLPGKPSRFGHISYWILDTEKAQDIIDRLIYRDKAYEKNTGITLSLLYPRRMSSSIPEIETTMTNAGYNISCKGITTDPHAQILAHTDFASIENSKKIRKLVPSLKNAQFTLSPNNYPCGETDFTLVLSDSEQ